MFIPCSNYGVALLLPFKDEEMNLEVCSVPIVLQFRLILNTNSSGDVKKNAE
jgi:hypothetical protein